MAHVFHRLYCVFFFVRFKKEILCPDLPLEKKKQVKEPFINRQVGQYLNRLSDLLFQMARMAQHAEGQTDRFKDE